MSVLGVMGGHEASRQTTRLAFELGAMAARSGWDVLTGGRDEGVMAAATAGAHSAGGRTIAVHPGRREDGTHVLADVIIFTGMGFARNVVNVLSSDAVVALPGAAGTLSEVAYADTYQVPLALLGFDDKGWFAGRAQRFTSVNEVQDWLDELG